MARLSWLKYLWITILSHYYVTTLFKFCFALSLSVCVEVNVSRSQVLFNSLVCVNVQEDQLISQMLQHRLQPSCHGNKVADGPSLLLFMTSDHLRQKPFPLEEEPVNYKPRPLTYPACSTFDLHRRERRWEAMPWHTGPLWLAGDTEIRLNNNYHIC